ncbi:14151_t:CDS:2, partial [Ambispora leptoticha]
FDKYMVHSTKSSSDAAAKYCKGLKELKNKETLSSEDIQEINANTINNIENKKKDIRMSAHINQDLLRDGAISSIRQRLNKQMQNLVPLSLTNVEEASVASELIEDQPHITDPDIVNNVVESAEKGEQHFIIDILNFIVPEYIKKRLLIPNNTTIKLHISGDGRNVGRKVQHVMVTAIILNDIDRLHKPEGYYTLVLYSGSKNYQSLQNALCTLIFDLNNLRESGFYQLNGLHWNVELFFSADWKFLVTCLGFNSANANHFCLWCTCMKQQNGILDQNNKLVGD